MSEGNETWIEFDCQCFYNFICEDVSNSNVGKLLSHMQKDEFYRVLSVFKKSYNKWRLERSGKRNEKLKIHLQLLDEYHFAYNVRKKYKYICVNSKDIGVYIGHVF